MANRVAAVLFFVLFAAISIVSFRVSAQDAHSAGHGEHASHALHDRSPENLARIGWKSEPANALMRLAMPSFEVSQIVNQVSAARMRELVEKISSFGRRSAGTADNAKAVAFIAEHFRAQGLTVEEHCFSRRPGELSKTCNVIAKKVATGVSPKPGVSPDVSSDVILVMAHLDSVGHNLAGADDNASGTAALLAMAEVLRTQSTKKNIWFFATNAEEDGLVGASEYRRALEKSGELKRVKFAINMDMIGYNADGIVDIETNSEFKSFADWMAQQTQLYTSLKPNIAMPAWGSDHVPFIKAGVPTVQTIEHWDTKTPCYHAACDKPETLNYGYAAEIVKLNLAALLQL